MKAEVIAQRSKIFNVLYGGFDGYSVSHEAKTNHKEKKDKSGKVVDNILYGETLFETVGNIFTHPLVKEKVKQAKVFYDLGSGTGNVVIAAALLKLFDKCCGIELLEGLYKRSALQHKKLVHVNKDLAARVQFFNSSFTDHDFSDADVIYANHPTKDPEIQAQLEAQLLKLKPGSLITYVIHTMHDNVNFTKLGSEKFTFSWGEATVHFYERK